MKIHQLVQKLFGGCKHRHTDMMT